MYCRTLIISTLFEQNLKLKFHHLKNGFHCLKKLNSFTVVKSSNLFSGSIKQSVPSPLRAIYKTHLHLSTLTDTDINVEEEGVEKTILTFLCNRECTDQPITLIDMTFGDGNHTKLILENIGPVNLICLDRDPFSYEKAKVLSKQDKRVIPVHGKFSDLPNILMDLNYKFNSIDGILIDSGVSESQITSKRGFSTNSNSFLDMRMDNDGITAYEVLYAISEFYLGKVLKIYGEENNSKKISQALIETRYTFKKVKTTNDLNELVSAVLGTDVRQDPIREKVEPIAQKVFNGLRRFVNNELNELNFAMLVAEKYLKPGGILISSNHSIVEDKIVKRHLTGNVIEHCANNMSLKFVSHNLKIESDEFSTLTFTPWDLLTKNISNKTDLKVRVAMKKE